MAGSDSDDSLEIIEEKSTKSSSVNNNKHNEEKKQNSIELLSETDISDSDSDEPIVQTSPRNNKGSSISSLHDFIVDLEIQKSRQTTLNNSPPTTINPNKRPQSMRELMAGAAMQRLKKSKLNETNTQLEDPISNNTEKNISSTKILASKPNQISKPTTTFQTTTLNQASTSAPHYKSQVRLIGNKEYCEEFQNGNGDIDTVTMTDLIGSSILEKTFQFNFMIDANFILSFINTDPLNVEIVLINSGEESHLALDVEHKMQYRIKNIAVAKLIPRFGSHHTKMMINFFHDDTCQIVIHTMNLTFADYKLQTQMAWISPRLRRLRNENDYQDFERNDLNLIEDNGIIFKKDLIKYIRSYGMNEFNELIDELSKHDFSKVDVQFIASSPGDYEFDVHEFEPNLFCAKSDLYGYGKLHQLMQEYSLCCPDNTKFIAQPSTIAYPVDSKSRNIFLHLLTSILEGSSCILKDQNFKFTKNKNYTNQPIIIWPTDKEIVSNHYKQMSGNALFFQSKKNPGAKVDAPGAHYNTLKNFFYKWNSKTSIGESQAGRSKLSPHVKTYTATDDDFKSLKWFLLTSSNLSKQAWGSPKSFAKSANQQKSHKYTINSFETGVLINPKTVQLNDQDKNKDVVLIPVLGRDSLGLSVKMSEEDSNRIVRYPVRLPYDVPLEKYQNGDLPWSKESMARL